VPTVDAADPPNVHGAANTGVPPVAKEIVVWAKDDFTRNNRNSAGKKYFLILVYIEIYGQLSVRDITSQK
jgi:hypothetical protein